MSHTHLMKCHRIILHCHEIFAQVCESARINFESYQRAVKASASAGQRIVQRGLAGVTMWRVRRSKMISAIVLVVIATFASVVR